MPNQDSENPFTGYKAVWLFVMFDLPVKTKLDRKRYAQFRARLLRQGFSQIQYSIYARYFASEAHSEPIRREIAATIPPQGLVRLLRVTDRQFGRMESFCGKKVVENERPYEQLLLF